jgi:hypothetical protein
MRQSTSPVEGVDANRIGLATAWLRLTDPEVPNDQAGFENGLTSTDPIQSTPNTMKVTFAAKKNTARGTYKLIQIRLNTVGDAPKIDVELSREEHDEEQTK